MASRSAAWVARACITARPNRTTAPATVTVPTSQSIMNRTIRKTGIHGTSKNAAAAMPVSDWRNWSRSRSACARPAGSPRTAASNRAVNTRPETRWSRTTP